MVLISKSTNFQGKGRSTQIRHFSERSEKAISKLTYLLFSENTNWDLSKIVKYFTCDRIHVKWVFDN